MILVFSTKVVVI